ncbi:GNAT family N-acetyltransferase [Rubrobacter marinus]|uniref:GNAT family N-acetyltransferase n=2 Tax=Rubrobacter marinus TaxID=2653852 RepID=A0A6G8Q2J0_9ACTN|nr:GNAT family N-acetyltransferase [Rubrobacter marinus]
MLADYAALIRAGEVYVLVDGSVVAGVLVLRPLEDAVLVENVAVRPSYQGSGLGRELMRFAEEFAHESGAREIHLYTNERMTENIAFYERLGYREIERRLDDGYRRVFMRKELPEA